MNIGIISAGVDPDHHNHVIPTRHETGMQGFAHMYLNHKTFFNGVHAYDRIKKEIDLLLLLPGGDWDRQQLIMDIADDFRGITLCHNFEPPAGWIDYNPIAFTQTVDLFEKCDAVTTHCEYILPFMAQFVATPAFFLGEVNLLATYKDYYPAEDTRTRSIIFLPHLPIEPHTRGRSSYHNLAIAKALERMLPYENGFEFHANVWNADECNHADLKMSTREFLQRYDLNFIKPHYGSRVRSRFEMIKYIQKFALLINMDMLNALGHWNIEAAALGIPTLTTDKTGASPLFEETFDIFNIDTAAKKGYAMLMDPEAHIQVPLDRSWMFAAPVVRERLETNLHRLKLL